MTNVSVMSVISVMSDNSVRTIVMSDNTNRCRVMPFYISIGIMYTCRLNITICRLNITNSWANISYARLNIVNTWSYISYARLNIMNTWSYISYARLNIVNLWSYIRRCRHSVSQITEIGRCLSHRYDIGTWTQCISCSARMMMMPVMT